MRSYSFFYRNIGEGKYRDWSGYVDCGVGGDVFGVVEGYIATSFGDGVGDIRLAN
jgi:hypothetical protein